MCGRYELNETQARLGSRYRIDAGDLGFAPNADVRATDTNPVILLADGQRIASMRRWGFVPSWAKDEANRRRVGGAPPPPPRRPVERMERTSPTRFGIEVPRLRCEQQSVRGEVHGEDYYCRY
jgi:SOS response associated peptidase (SRAP)